MVSNKLVYGNLSILDKDRIHSMFVAQKHLNIGVPRTISTLGGVEPVVAPEFLRQGSPTLWGTNLLPG